MTLASLASLDVAASVFADLQPQAPDVLLALIGMHRRDPRLDKLDLGVGVYRDASGATPIMAAVRTAEQRLWDGQDTKAYLGAEGDVGYLSALAEIALGDALAEDPRITGVQTPGGTGALRLGAELIARAGRKPRVWMGVPTWPNHGPIFREAGLEVAPHPYYDTQRSAVAFDAMMASLAQADRGDVLLVHGCCHNPTGADLSIEQWGALATFVSERGIVPFVDLAYQGLGNGLEADARGARLMLASAPDALVAYSCDKNFALYRERVGALWVQTENTTAIARARENMLVLARSLWSMPPDHGAATARIVLEDPHLHAVWLAELDAMRERINALRAGLAAADPRLAPIAWQRGLFAMLPIDRAAVVRLREDHGIYMAESGRINVAGLCTETIAPFVAALAPHLQR